MADVMRSRQAAVAVVALLMAAAPPARAERIRLADWETIASERYGFMLAYPGSVFSPKASSSPDDGQVLVSKDGAARLLVAAFENDTQTTLAAYRDQLLSDNYTGATLDYAPVKDKWFVVSGTRGDMHFYERVSFTCGGKLINSWALLYPVAERSTYDRVVEAIARTYTPGAGRTGVCD